MDWVREPAVAGRFYPGEARSVAREVAKLMPPAEGPAAAVAVVLPHAGWIYSGAIAGAALARVEVPARVIVLCPNHTGQGVRKALWPEGTWRLPGGDVKVDADLAALVQAEAGLTPDRAAHRSEHAVEVQLPLLRARRADVAVVPVCLGHLDAAECVALGEGLARAVRRSAGPVLLVASTDMSHYIAADVAKRLDRLALDRVEALDAAGLHAVVEENDLSMCGYIPTTVVVAAAKALGARRGELVRYGNSGETTGDSSEVVGYASLVLA